MNLSPTEITLPQAVADLEVLLPQLDQSSREFANSLINGPYGYKMRKFLTPKQEPHVYRLLAKAMGITAPTLTVKIGGLAGIHAMFEKAKQKLKYPKIVFHLDGHEIKMWVQGETAKVPGALAVTVNGGWVGRILTSGELEPGKSFEGLPQKDAVIKLLQEFAAAPAEVAAKYGKLSSHCVFCQLPLTDPKSLAVGYGPTCAKHYGLKWGAEKLALAEVA